MNPRPTAKEIAAAALKRGDLRVEGEAVDFKPTDHMKAAEWNVPGTHYLNVKLPNEVGLSPVRPTPKTETPHLLRHPPRKAGNRKYVITKAQAIAQGIKLP